MPGIGIGIGMGMGVGKAQASLFDRVLAELFGSGEQGIYMPSVHESFLRGDLYQDAAGTTPVTAAGQSVGLWLDRSGNDNNASQTTAASRPTLQQDANGMYVLRFDGMDDFMVTPSIDFTGTDKMTVLTGSHVTKGIISILELSNTIANPGAMSVQVDAVFNLLTAARGNNLTTYRGSLVSPSENYLTAYAIDLSKAAVLEQLPVARINASEAEIGSGTGSIGSFANAPLFVGSRAGTSRFLASDIYGLTAVGAQKSLAQIEAAERLINKYTRAF